MKNGIALFRYAGVDAVRKKLGQLRDLEVIASMDATKMSGTGTERFDIPTVEKGFESLRVGMC